MSSNMSNEGGDVKTSGFIPRALYFKVQETMAKRHIGLMKDAMVEAFEQWCEPRPKVVSINAEQSGLSEEEAALIQFLRGPEPESTQDRVLLGVLKHWASELKEQNAVVPRKANGG